jgi:hypothetical protein
MRRAGAAAVLALLALAGCGKPEAPKVDPAVERAQATERAKQGPYGSQVQSLEGAKALGDDLNRKAQDRVDDAEKNAK